MGINRKFFFDVARADLFDGKFRQAQVDGLTAILDKWEQTSPQEDDRWLAYMLGTAHHETGRTMQPVRETFARSDESAIKRLNASYRAGGLSWVSRPYWEKDEQGKSWLGRGFVQITHKYNYKKMSAALGIDLVGQPDLAMDPVVALEIIFQGMIRGLFTGKKLSNYFRPSKEDWKNARRIVNGNERDDLVASYAKQYYRAISYTTGA
jgi:predicted chitinase